MSRRTYLRTVLLTAACLLPAAALAQQPGETTAAATLSVIRQFDTDLERDGEFHWAAATATASVRRQIDSQLAVGLTLRYDFEDWSFSQPTAFGGAAPWSRLNEPSVSLDIGFAPSPETRIGFSPLVGWAFESGAATGDALTYGAIVTATRVLSPTLLLGIGVGVVRQIDDTKVFPFAVVSWQIDERWRLGNPFSAGPAGGAGLELSFAPDETWEIAAGGTYRSTRYRLDGDSAAPGGVGENRFIPVFVRVARNFGASTRLDLYAGIAVRGRLLVASADGATIAKDDYSTAPLLGLTLAHRF